MKSSILRSQLRSRYDLLSKLVEDAQKQLKNLPEGRLKVKRQGKKISYYHVTDATDSNGVLIESRKLAGKLAQKAYCRDAVKAAEAERKALKKLIDNYPEPSVDDLYGMLTDERKKLVTPHFYSDEEYLRRWLDREYPQKEFKEGMPFYYTLKGERVRSKSEQIIADRLAANDIPYKYECPLQIGEYVYHPDFTILKVKQRQEVYLEHFGMMDHADYAKMAVKRINEYASAGIVLGDRLFMTCEAGSVPLDVRTLDVLIESQFK